MEDKECVESGTVEMDFGSMVKGVAPGVRGVSGDEIYGFSGYLLIFGERTEVVVKKIGERLGGGYEIKVSLLFGTTPVITINKKRKKQFWVWKKIKQLMRK